MAATGYTPIQLYYSTTASAAPVAGNLAAGELAINTNDGKLYYKDSGGTVQTIASKATGSVPGSTTQVIYNNAGALAGSANLTFNGTTLTANTIGAFTLSGTIAGGGNQLNNIVIGTSTPLAGSFTTVSASTSVTTPSVTNAGTLALSATGANVVTASTNGSERMRIDSSGNVGIGTTSPSANSLTLASKSVVLTTGYGMSWHSGATQIAGYDTDILQFITASSERMRIDASGNLLVGGTAARGTTVGAAHLDLFNGTAPAGTLTNGISLYSASGDFNFMDSSGNGYKVGFRNVPAVGTKTGSYTLATGDVGKYVQVGSGGSITIPTSTFAEGDVVSLMNNTTAGITITCSAPTSYIAGTDSAKTSMTLATRGVATVFFISSTVCVVTGNVS